jgi:glycolate oxidase FAD binding subunit
VTPTRTSPDTVEPDTAEALASALGRASDLRQSVVIRGAGTKMDWGRPPRPIDAVLSTRRLSRVIAYEHGDLTMTVEAGAALHDVNRVLAARGQWLPLDPPFADRATIGGILAANDSGPLRHRFGTPRDLVIGVRLATTDGLLAKAGGQVVKNVAGYDLSKLVSGSFGSLAAIVSATFKLSPLFSASKTMVVDAPDLATLGQIVRDVAASQLEPMAFELRVVAGRSTPGPHSSPSQISSTLPAGSAFHGSLLIRFASVAAAVEAQIDQTRAMAAMKGCTTDLIDGDAEQAVWHEHGRRLWSAPGAIVRASWMPANIVAAMDVVSGISRTVDLHGIEVIGRAAVGAGLIRIDGDAAAQAAVVNSLRQSPAFGNVVIVRGAGELKALVDVWGTASDGQRLSQAIKRALDPNGILNAGRGPV